MNDASMSSTPPAKQVGTAFATPAKQCSTRMTKKTTPPASSDDVKVAFGKVVNSVVALDAARASVTKDGKRCEDHGGW